MAERIAIVTGVSRGLGESLAADLLGRGFDVIGIGRRSGPRLSSANFRLVRADLGEIAALPSIIDPLFADVAARAPQVAVLINNAAVAGPTGLIGTLAPADIVASISTNLTAPLVLANAFVRAFARVAGDRRVINVSSGAAVRALRGSGVYCSSKAALEMVTQAIAEEAEATGIAAVTIRPGIIDTPMQAYMRSQPSERLPDVAMFEAFHTSGQLVPPDVTAARIVERLVIAPVEHGRAYSYAEL